MSDSDRWMSWSVGGSMPQSSKHFSEDSTSSTLHSSSNVVGPDGVNPDFHLHTALASLGLLMTDISNEVLAPQTVSLETVRFHSDRLHAWHAHLPEFLTLSSAVRESHGDPPSRKSSTLLTHCAYLSAILMLTRRLFLERMIELHLTGGGSASFELPINPEIGSAEEFSRMCVSAARQLATVVEMLLADTRLTTRSWLVIQSAYTACIVICLDVAGRRGRPMLESALEESLGLINKCLTVLQHCALFNSDADRYAKVLQPLYRVLSTPELTPAAKRARLYRDPFSGPFSEHSTAGEVFLSNEELIEHFSNLLKLPNRAETLILDQSLISMCGDNLVEHHRCMPEPAPNHNSIDLSESWNPYDYFHQHPNQHEQQQHYYTYPPEVNLGNNVDPLPEGSGPQLGSETNFFNDVRMGNSSPSGKQHFRTKEEYEAFFKRVT